MGDAQRCRNAVSELVQAAEEINRRPELLELICRLTCIQSWQGSRALLFPKDPGLSQSKVWLFK